MRLTHVAVEGCGRFATACRIEGLGPGVNVLSASNEAGKSTLFRAIRTCLFERHSSTKEEIQALATEGLSLPVIITVAFEKDGHAYEIRKSFLRGKAASLSRDGVEMARGAEADEEVLKLLGIEQRSARALDEAAFGILWVAQGRSFETPEPSEGARSALNAVIQQEVGTLVGGERARLLVASVNEELARYVTRGGQSKAGGPLQLAEEERARLSAERLDAETRLAALRARLEELEKLRREHKAASDPATLHSLQDQLAEATRKRAEAEKAASELMRLDTEERQAHELARAQQERLASLGEQEAAIDGQRARLKEIASALAPLDQQDETVTAALRQASAALRAREEELAALRTREAELQRLEALTLKLQRRTELEQQLSRLADFRLRAAANEAALAAATIDAAVIKSLEAIEREESRIRDALEAGAARLAVAVKPGAAVTLNDMAVDGNSTRAVTEPITIAVGSDVSITVSPPPEALESASTALARERGKREALLQRHGAASAAELRQRHAERIEIETAARDLRAERGALGIAGDPAAEIDRLSAAIAAITLEAQRIRPEGTLPLADEIAAEKARIAERVSLLQAEHSSFAAQADAHKEALTRLADTRGRLRGQSKEILVGLESALALLPDERRQSLRQTLAEELARRTDAHRVKAAALEQARAGAPAADEAERQTSRIERFTAALEGQKKRADELRQSIARLEGEVMISGGEGLGEKAAVLKLQEEMAMAEEARLKERVEVLKLLRSTVDGCYARRREQLNAPLLRHLRPFLGDVFPEAEIELGENFTVAGVSRGGREYFERLSLGTQEQIAVLVRLAMGAMMCERGAHVPIILDDALVFSDDSRIEQMFDAINRAGRNQQVIVLTCRARSFASLGGRELRIVDQ